MWRGGRSTQGKKERGEELLASNGRARQVNRSSCWGVQIGESVVDEVDVLSGGAISVRHVTRGSLAGTAVNAGENNTNLSHEHSEGNINNIISRSSSVGEASEISSNDSQGVLCAVGGDGGRGVESQQILEGSGGVVLEGINAGNSLEENVNQILSWEVAWLEVSKIGFETSIHGGKEQIVEDHGICGVENIMVESLSKERRKLIPSILGDESSEELVDQRISLPGLLSVVVGTEGG